MNCPRCSALVVDEHLVDVVDTPTGLLAITPRPVAAHQLACRCGSFTITIASSTSCTPHPAQLTLIQGAA